MYIINKGCILLITIMIIEVSSDIVHQVGRRKRSNVPPLNQDFSDRFSPNVYYDSHRLAVKHVRFKNQWTLTGKTTHVYIRVCVDSTMENYYGKNLDKYIHTTLASEEYLLSLKGLGMKTKFYLGEIYHMTANEMYHVSYRLNAEKTIDAFRNWHNTLQLKDYDVILYFTRVNMNGFYGMAYMNGACTKLKRDVLVYDNGFYATGTVAHEIGHLLGITHTFSTDECEQLGPTFIMSRVYKYMYHNHEWSMCSIRKISEHRARFTCLDNPPRTNKIIQIKNIKDVKYSIQEMCEIEYGPTFLQCDLGEKAEMCKFFGCKQYQYSECKKTRWPEIPIVVCSRGRNKKCDMNFKCKEMGRKSNHFEY